MNVGQKLALLVVASALLFIGSYGITWMLLGPLDRVSTEQRLLENVGKANLKLQMTLSSLWQVPLSTDVESIQKAVEENETAYSALSGVTLIPQLTKDLGAALKAVQNLKSLSDESIQTFQSVLKDLSGIAEFQEYAGQGKTLLDLYTFSKANSFAELEYALVQLNANMLPLKEALLTSSTVIARQASFIEEEVGKIKSQAFLTVALVLLVMLLLVTAASFWLARSITTAIRSIDRNIALVSNGDLTIRFQLKSRDELGRLATNLDKMIDAWNTSLSIIQKAASDQSKMKEQLVQTVSTATSSSIEIEANSRSIQSQMGRLDSMIITGARKMNGISEAFGEFKGKIDVQEENVSSTTASADQMLSSISRIAELTTQDRKAVGELVNRATDGQIVLEAAFARVAEIAGSVEEIQEMAQIIADIASQTGILALNAAIEAAHAGEFGKGFSVVADEITKLASVSAESSAQIARSLPQIVSSLTAATSTKTETSEAFEAIRNQIDEVALSLTEIEARVSDLQVGGRTILGSMAELNSHSESITTQAASLVVDSQEVAKTLDEVGRISQEVNSNIGEISLGLNTITQTVQHVSEDATQIGRIGEQLEESVSQFQTQRPSFGNNAG